MPRNTHTVNKDIAAIKKASSFALEIGVIEQHPLVRFPLVRVQEKARMVLEPSEFRHLVNSMDRLEIAAMTAVLGETGIRKAEGLGLRRDRHVRVSRGIITLDHTKNGKVKDVPLSHYAIKWLNRLVHRVDCPYVFINPTTDLPWVNPEKPFKEGCKAAGLGWVGFHDLRRYRATQWLRLGVDVRTVKDLLGHADIQTTMKYALSVPDHAIRSVREAEKLETEELTQTERMTNG